jgi:transcriptional regulator with XRE-family HTH domain
LSPNVNKNLLLSLKYQRLPIIIHDKSLKVNTYSLISHYYIEKMGYNFRENLRNELNFQGITVKELSARTGIPIATLDCYIGTRATVPSVDAAVKIAQALQVSVEYLAIGEKASLENPHKKNSQEARNIIRWVESLSTDQCKAVQNMISVFNKNRS